MFFTPPQNDEKNNLISLTLFESYLAKFILEHPEIYQTAFLKLLRGIQSASAHQERACYGVFSLLSQAYPEYQSFTSFDTAFSLPAADYLLKLSADHLFPPESTPAAIDSPRTSRRSPANLSRNPLLFDEHARGVTEIDSEDYTTTETLGIVSEKYTPEVFKHYFENEIEPSGQFYIPNEDSYVALWLRQYQVPLISGASGSTQALIARLLPKAPQLTKEEKQLIVFAEACNMVAHGHHSLFEALMVADDMELISIDPQASQAAFYLQCVPESIQNHLEFIRFFHGNLMQSLLSIPVENSYSPIDFSIS